VNKKQALPISLEAYFTCVFRLFVYPSEPHGAIKLYLFGIVEMKDGAGMTMSFRWSKTQHPAPGIIFTSRTNFSTAPRIDKNTKLFLF